MSEIEELESRVQNIPKEEFTMFRDWFFEIENEIWDKQIASDFNAGKFNQLIKNAKDEFAQGKARHL